MKRMACVIALAAGSGLAGYSALPALAEPSPAAAVSGLQVTVVPPGTVSTDSTIPLDVKFHGGNIKFIELFIDGTKLTGQAVSTRDGRGVIHFTIDPTLLSEGSHEVLVKAYEPDGTCATTTTQISVASGDVNALAKFEWPKRNSEVQGIVPIKVKIDSSITEPYVTFVVDNDFLAFRNYAPYVYNWDSAKVGNGKHTIGIEVMDGKTLQVVQKLTLQVNVKNIDGFTNIQGTQTKPPVVETGSMADTIEGIAESTLPATSLNTQDDRGGLARSTGSIHLLDQHRIASPIETVLPGAGIHTKLPVNAAQSGIPKSILPDVPVVQPKRVSRSITAPSVNPPVNANVPHFAPGLDALASDPRDLMPAPKATFGLARQSAHFRRLGGIALRPGTERRTVSSVPVAAVLPGFPKSSLKTFDVMFGNSLIKFDVAPRIENGLPLAPFRAIFEHSGGLVKWNNDDKIVRASDTDREIEIRIGNKEAKVNSKSLMMEATPYLDHGRTIVPLSFIRDAMDLKVTFDPETGHLLIEKK